jgi:hypothetical protein
MELIQVKAGPLVFFATQSISTSFVVSCVVQRMATNDSIDVNQTQFQDRLLEVSCYSDRGDCAMNQPKSRAGEGNGAANFPLPDFLPAMMDMQREVFEGLDQVNRDWLAWLESEIRLTSDFASKLTEARSVPDTATAWQACASRQLELLAENGRHFFADGQKLIETGTRYLSKVSPIHAAH